MESHSRASRRLAGDLGATPWIAAEGADLLVNCTAVGLRVERSSAEPVTSTNSGLEAIRSASTHMSQIWSTAHHPPRCLPPPRPTERERSTVWTSSSRRARSASSCGPAVTRRCISCAAPLAQPPAERPHAAPPRAEGTGGVGSMSEASQPVEPDLHAIFGMDGERVGEAAVSLDPTDSSDGRRQATGSTHSRRSRIRRGDRGRRGHRREPDWAAEPPAARPAERPSPITARVAGPGSRSPHSAGPRRAS